MCIVYWDVYCVLGCVLCTGKCIPGFNFQFCDRGGTWFLGGGMARDVFASSESQLFSLLFDLSITLWMKTCVLSSDKNIFTS